MFPVKFPVLRGLIFLILVKTHAFLINCPTQFAVHESRLFYFRNSLFDGRMFVNDVSKKSFMSPIYVFNIIEDKSCVKGDLANVSAELGRIKVLKAAVFHFEFFISGCSTFDHNTDHIVPVTDAAAEIDCIETILGFIC